jgi:hypothetical protein
MNVMEKSILIKYEADLRDMTEEDLRQDIDTVSEVVNTETAWLEALSIKLAYMMKDK